MYNPPEIMPNTLPSLVLAELAREHGSFEEIHRALFTAYWSEGKNIGDVAVLDEILGTADIDMEQYAEAFREGRFTQRILESTGYAHSVGVTGVPAWQIDKRLLIMGAQPHEALENTLGDLGYYPAAA